MISIVVPAHNECSVIARTLGTWVNKPGADGLQIVVVCNGCTDDTSEIARGAAPGARVIETDIAGKTHALNLGDQVAGSFPRVYVDADVVITVDAIEALASRLAQGTAVLAVAPTPEINLENCSWLVRLYYDVRSRLPSSREGIGGSGVYALSEQGRKRFNQFPNVIADDIFVRLQFSPEERETLPTVKSTVFPPRTITQLLRVRTRAYAGTSQIDREFPELRTNRATANHRTLIGLFARPQLWLGLLVYSGVNTIARFKAKYRRVTKASTWERDGTSRLAQPRPTAK